MSFRCRACGRIVALDVNACPSCRALGTMQPSDEPPEIKPPRIRGASRDKEKKPPTKLPNTIETLAALSTRLSSSSASSAASNGRALVSSVLDGSKERRAPLVIDRLADVQFETRERYRCSTELLDNAFGWEKALGVAKGSKNIVGGPPGCYKTTLMIENLASIADRYQVPTAIVQAEMDRSFVAEYADRFGLFERYPGARALLDIIEVETLQESYDAVLESGAEVYLLDSIQGVNEQDGTPVVTVARKHGRRCEEAMRDKTGFLIAHGTKDGDVSGVLAMQHAVDATFLFEYFDEETGEWLSPNERQDTMRVRCPKNRFAPNDSDCGAYRIVKGSTPQPMRGTRRQAKPRTIGERFGGVRRLR